MVRFVIGKHLHGDGSEARRSASGAHVQRLGLVDGHRPGSLPDRLRATPRGVLTWRRRRARRRRAQAAAKRATTRFAFACIASVSATSSCHRAVGDGPAAHPRSTAASPRGRPEGDIGTIKTAVAPHGGGDRQKLALIIVTHRHRITSSASAAARPSSRNSRSARSGCRSGRPSTRRKSQKFQADLAASRSSLQRAALAAGRRSRPGRDHGDGRERHRPDFGERRPRSRAAAPMRSRWCC